jgi:hypothetical protein
VSETQIILETDVRCTDGPCGRLHRLLITSADKTHTLTHLAVKPHSFEAGRLVPVDRIASAGAGADIMLVCSGAEFEQLEPAEEMLLPPEAPEQEAWPFTANDIDGRFPAGFEHFEEDSAWANLTTTLDRIPTGGAELLHGEPVYATDGPVGRTQGLIVDLRGGQVTHVLLDMGHLWSRTRFAVPAASVTNLADGIRLDLTKDQVHELPDILSGDATRQ